MAAERYHELWAKLRGPELLNLVASFGLPVGSAGVDVGCGDGGHTRVLADRFGFDMVWEDGSATGQDSGPELSTAFGSRSQSGKKFTVAEATSLNAEAKDIEATLGC